MWIVRNLHVTLSHVSDMKIIILHSSFIISDSAFQLLFPQVKLKFSQVNVSYSVKGKIVDLRLKKQKPI